MPSLRNSPYSRRWPASVIWHCCTAQTASGKRPCADSSCPPHPALPAGHLSQAALDPAQVRQLAAERFGDKVAAIRGLAQAADPDAARILKAMADDSLYLAGGKAVIIDGDKAFDAASGAAVDMPASPRRSR